MSMDEKVNGGRRPLSFIFGGKYMKERRAFQ